MVPPGRVELPLPKEEDFESTASTNSATGALYIGSSAKGSFDLLTEITIVPYYSEKRDRINENYRFFLKSLYIVSYLCADHFVPALCAYKNPLHKALLAIKKQRLDLSRDART